MARRSKGVYVLAAIMVVGLLAALGANAFAAFAGASSDEPFTWDGRSKLTVVYQGATPGAVGCEITPRTGEPRRLTVPHARVSRFATMPATTVSPWFSGDAEVVCSDARLFTGTGATVTEYRNYPAMLVLIGVIGMAWIRMGRRRRRRPR